MKISKCDGHNVKPRVAAARDSSSVWKMILYAYKIHNETPKLTMGLDYSDCSQGGRHRASGVEYRDYCRPHKCSEN